MQGPALDRYINTFAIRSFRDTADRDYVHARLAYRSRLIQQFQWSSLHCLEKYAKGILLLNRIPAKKLRHQVSGALSLLTDSDRFSIELSDAAREFVNELEFGAEFRYYEVSYHSQPYDIMRLDLAVSELRRYCQVLAWASESRPSCEVALQASLQRIRAAQESNSRDTCIVSGWLEQVIRDRKHPARLALLWQNLYFGPSSRKSVRLRAYEEAGNSPMDMHPFLLDEVLRYIYFPPRLVKEWRLEIARREREGAA